MPERIRHIVTIALAITAAVPASFQLFELTPNLLILGMAGLLFLLCLALCTIATAKNELVIVSIKPLFFDYLHIPEFATKTALIKYAGEDQERNLRYLAIRHRLIVLAMASLAAEILLLAISGLFGY